MTSSSESEIPTLVSTAGALLGELAMLAPQLVANFRAAQSVLHENDIASLNAEIMKAHTQIQALDAQLQALGSSGARPS